MSANWRASLAVVAMLSAFAIYVGILALLPMWMVMAIALILCLVVLWHFTRDYFRERDRRNPPN